MANAGSSNLSSGGEAKAAWSLLPSWLASVLVHVVVFFFCMTTLRSCGGGDFSGKTSETFRDVGIYVRDNQPAQEVVSRESVTETVQEQPVEALELPPIDQSPQLKSLFLKTTSASESECRLRR